MGGGAGLGLWVFVVFGGGVKAGVFGLITLWCEYGYCNKV